MKENSIEKTLENIQNVDLITLLRKFKKEGVKNFIVIRRNDFDEILSDYKRVLKENEELNKKIKEQKECAFREDGTEECLWYCSSCHDEWLFYEGTPEENNLKYCPHCGARIREIIKLEEEDE